MGKTLLSTVFLLCFASILVRAQKGTGTEAMSSLTVMAKDAETGEPVHMATVYIVPEGDTLATAFTFTDKKGIASLKDFAAGRYVVNIQILGFKPYAKELMLEAQTIRTISAALKQDLQELEGASITEMGDLVTVKGDTLIYNATSFHTASNASLGDLLKKMPGIEIEKGRVKVNGEPVKRITVEGKTFFFDDQSKALENLPASIVNKIKVIDKENQGRFGLSRKEKEMDIRLKDEYREVWFGKASAEGGVSLNDNSSERFGSGSRGLYNAKLFSQYYSDNDNFTIIGGGNNVNANQLSRASSGLSDIASGGVNYNTARIPGYDTDASASYDFRNNDNRSESHRTSFLNSGDRLETNRSQASNTVSHSAKAGFKIGVPRYESGLTQGFVVNGDMLYRNIKSTCENNSSTSNSAGEELNGSESHTSCNSNDFAANVKLRAKYFLDKELKHHISIGGNLGYKGTIGDSKESSITRFKTSAEEQSLLYADKADAMLVNANLNYRARLSNKWNIYSIVSADFNSSKENRDAQNENDYSRNDYYSKYSCDSGISLNQMLYATYEMYLGNHKYFSTNFGACVYEDNIRHFSKTYGTSENRNDIWQINAGPDIVLSYRDSSWTYSLYTRGKTIAPAQDALNNTTLVISNPTDVSTGNIYLKAGYHQDASISVSRGSRNAGGNYLSLRLDGSMDINEMTRASWYDYSAVRYSIPVNAKRPRYNAGLNLIYIQPLNKKKSLNLTITPKAFFSTGTIYVSDGPLNGLDKEKFNYADMMEWLYGDSEGSSFYSGESGFIENRTHNLNWSTNVDLKYELSAWSLRCGVSVNNSFLAYSAAPASKISTWRYNAYAEALWRNKSGWEAEGRFDFNGYSGFSRGYNRPDYLLNLKLAKTIKSFTVSLSAYDILGTSKSFSHIASAEYIEDTYRNNLGRCILVGLSYNFGKWSFAKRARLEALENKNNL